MSLPNHEVLEMEHMLDLLSDWSEYLTVLQYDWMVKSRMKSKLT